MAARPNTVLLTLQDSLIQATSPGRDVVRVGGFLALFHATESIVWLNQAMPVGPCTAEDVAALIAAFRERDRTPWLEFYPALWPDVAPLLDAAGFVCEKRMPVMVLPRTDWKGHRSDIETSAARLDDAATLNEVSCAAYGDGPTGDAAAARKRSALESGRVRAAISRIDGIAVGCGSAVGDSSVREIAGIGTLPEFRRRGVASAVIAQLLDDFFGSGGEIAWLTPGDDGAGRVYFKLGFREIAEQVCYRGE